MIRNIVFDLGNVLISFRPAEYLEKNNYPPGIREVILADVFGSREWSMLDNGDLTSDEAIDLMSQRSSLKREEIALIFKKRTDIMFPLEKNVRLLPELKNQGFVLYYLSNFPSDIFDEVKSKYYFFSYFEGGIISADVKHSKPDVRIFQLLFEKFGINPEESLYIDDIESNSRAAEFSGMKTLTTFGSDDISEKVFASI
jgi:putative hydrolase of the HAD superfamily